MYCWALLDDDDDEGEGVEGTVAAEAEGVSEDDDLFFPHLASGVSLDFVLERGVAGCYDTYKQGLGKGDADGSPR